VFAEITDEFILGATNILIEPSQKSSCDGVFIARTVRIMNVTNQDQLVNEGTTLGHGEQQPLMTLNLNHYEIKGCAKNWRK
jgi:hypothetical protein